MRKETLDTCKTMVMVFAGCLLMSVALNGIYIPYKLLGGGVAGVCMLLNILFGIDINFTYVLLNIPLLLFGLFALPKRFMGYTAIGMILFAVSLTLTKGVIIPVNSALSAILLGGVLNGVAISMIYNCGASLGGTDILAKLFHVKYNINLSTVGFAMNISIIGASMIFFGLDIAVYTLAAMFVSTEVCNFLVDGVHRKRMVLIISDCKKQDLVDNIKSKLKRGVTVLRGEGAYTGKQKDILYCVVGITQVATLKTIVKAIDPNAFMTVTETAQVYGNGKGFYRIWDE